MEEVLLIVNPKSGVEKSRDSIVESAALLCEKRGLVFNVEYTKAVGDAETLARKAAGKGFKTVVVAGGDGTIRDAADGIWGSETTLGVLPMGSGNGLARSMGVSQYYEKALNTALCDNYVRIDRGLANGNSFYSAFGVGFDAEVSYKFSLDKRRGRTTYIKHAIREMFTFKPRKFRLLTDDSEIVTDAMLVAVCNCKQYGNNAYIAPKADPTDGELDVTVVHSGSFFAKVLAGLELFSGTLDRNILVENFKVKNIRIIDEKSTGHIITHMDGEPIKTSGEVEIGCEKNGIKIAVPNEVQNFKPFFTPMRLIFDDLILDIKKNLGTQTIKNKE